MKRFVIFILLVFLLAGCTQVPAETTALTTAPTTVPETTSAAEALHDAPDFTVYDLEGNPVALSDFRGKPVVLNFWASWCGPCKAEMPDFDEVSQALEGQVEFMMVNLTDGRSETVESASAFIAQAGYRFPVYYDTDMDATATYGIQSIPTTFFINAQGKLVAYYPGTISKEFLHQGIAMITE